MDEFSSPQVELDQPELAFEAMAQRLAGLTAAMDGFAARQQELHGRDYGPDLVKIQECFERVRVSVNGMANQPALALEPKDIAGQIERAGQQGREADHHAWGQAQGRLDGAARSIEAVVASALEFRVQRYWIAGSSAAALVIGTLLGMGLPGWIDWAAPESWHWPEASAATMLGRSERDAGFRLLQVADPDGWAQVSQAITVLRDNAQTLADCRAGTVKMKAAVSCKIRINGR